MDFEFTAHYTTGDPQHGPPNKGTVTTNYTKKMSENNSKVALLGEINLLISQESNSLIFFYYEDVVSV